MTDISRNEAAQIAAHCTECGVSHLTADFLGQGLSLDEVKARVSVVGTVMEMSTIARRKEPSIPVSLGADMLAEGRGVEEIRSALFERIVAEEQKTAIASHVPAAADTGREAPRRVDLVADMKKRVATKDGLEGAV